MSQLIIADGESLFVQNLFTAQEAVAAAQDDFTSALAGQRLAALKLQMVQTVHDELESTVNELLASPESSIDETVEKSDQLRVAKENLATAEADSTRADEWVKRAKKAHAKALLQKQVAEECATY